MRSLTRRPSNVRRGASAVEFAMVAPIMILLTFGLIEVGRLMLVQQTATYATREGARISVRPTADNADVVTRVEEELALFGIDNAIIETVPSDISTTPPGDPVTVRVRINASDVSWIPGFFDWAINEIVVESAMRRESTE